MHSYYIENTDDMCSKQTADSKIEGQAWAAVEPRSNPVVTFCISLWQLERIIPERLE